MSARPRHLSRGLLVSALLLTSIPAPGLAAFLNARDNALLEYDPLEVCRDGADALVLYDVTEDDPDQQPRFPHVVAASPPPGDPDDFANNPAPDDDTIVARADVALDYVPGGVGLDQDGDGEEDARYFYTSAFELRWERDGHAVELEPGDVVQIDIDEGQTDGPSAIDVTVRACWMDTQRVAGPTRWTTSTGISRLAYPEDGSAKAVVLARGDSPDGFADALSGAPLAAVVDGPVLLTDPASLLSATEEELVRVLPKGATVYLLGGESALAPAVAARVQELGYDVDRIAGDDRIETALAVAERLDETKAVLLTSGADFPDALAAGAAAIAVGGVVVLVPADARDARVDDYLAAAGRTPLFAVGGPAARPYPEAEPLFGKDRIETALAVAERFFPSPAVVGVARADAFPDSLSGGSHIGRLSGPLLLTSPTALDQRVSDHVCAATDTVELALLYGGEAALSEDIREAIAGPVSGDTCLS